MKASRPASVTCTASTAATNSSTFSAQDTKKNAHRRGPDHQLFPDGQTDPSVGFSHAMEVNQRHDLRVSSRAKRIVESG